MTQENDLTTRAKSIPVEARAKSLAEIPETELHRHLIHLFERADASVRAEVTHGPDELGRDLVLHKNDPFGEEFIGVVVKRHPYDRGVSGRTAGPIDEVISQANQAMAHTCRLKDIFVGEVTLTSVWILFFGRMSNNAAARIDFETNNIRGRRIITIGQLVELFTLHYPEVFFDGEAGEYLTNKIIEIENWQGVVANHTDRLSSWFVSPMVMVVDSKFEVPEQQLMYMVGTKRMPFNRLDEHIKPRAKLVLTGDPGSGKSVGLRKIAADMLKTAQQQALARSMRSNRGNWQPVSIPVLLNAVDANGGRSISELFEEQLPPTEIRDRFDIGLILLDGLDEVPKNSQQSILSSVFSLSDTHRCCLIISARKVPSLQMDIVSQASGKVEVFDILPFEMNQALELVKNVTADSTVFDIIRDGLVRISHQISFTPIALELLIEIAEAEREIPGSISEIFERYSDIALGRYDTQRGIEAIFEYFTKKLFLGELAWREFKGKDRLEISRAEFDEFIEDYIGIYDWDPVNFEALVNEIARSGILRVGDSVFFSHRSLLEFFCAFWVHENHQDLSNYLQTLESLYFDGIWSEVPLYAVGLARRADSALIQRLMSHESDDFQDEVMKFMIGRLLQAGWHSTANVKRDAIRSGIAAGDAVLDHFKEIRKAASEDIPAFVPILFLLGLGQHAYDSRILQKETLAILDELPNGASPNLFFRRLVLLWSARTRLEDQEIEPLLDEALQQLASIEEENILDIDERMASLWCLEQVSNEDQEAGKTVRRKLRRLARRYPSLRAGHPTANRR